MDLLLNETGKEFNTEAIEKGYLISAKHSCWTESKNGIVSSVSSDELRVIYCPGISNVTRFFFIKADDVADGQWDLRYSKDLQDIEEYKPEEKEPEKGETE